MRTLLVAFVLVLLGAGCGPGEETATDASPVGAEPTADTPAEPLRLVSVTADALKQEVRDLDADVVVVNAWATWCGPCRIEFPEFVRFARDKAAEGVAVRFLSVDEASALPQVQQFLAEHGVTGRTYVTAEGTEIVGTLAAPNTWGYGIPATLIYGPDGELGAFWEGTVNYDFLEAKVRQVREAAADAGAGTTTG